MGWVHATKSFRVWSHLGFRDLRSQFAQSSYGVLWSTISVVLSSLILGFVYSRLFGASPSEYLPYLAASLLSWGLIARAMSEGASTFLESRVLILNTSLPLEVFVLRVAWRSVATFLLGLPVIVLIVVLFTGLSWGFVGVLPGFGISIAFISGLAALFAIAGAMYPTLRYVVPSVVQLAFLVTPVLWPARILGDSQWIVAFNPLFYPLEVLRGPLIGQWPDARVWLLALMSAVVLLFISELAFRRWSWTLRTLV